MTDVITLAGIAAALLKIVLRVNDEAEAADLIGHAQEAASCLSRLKRHEQEIPKPITNRIEKRLQEKLHGMYDRCIGQGIDVNSLEPVATEVAILLEEMAKQKSLLVTAARSPEEFPNILQSNAAHRRSKIEENLEPYFDDLVIAVAEEYAQLAPWSPYYQQQSFNTVFDKLEDLIELGETNIELGKTNIEITQKGVHDLKEGQSQIRQAIEELPLKHPTQTRIFFGKRPSIASNFVLREEASQLYTLAITETTPRTVLIGMCGSGKSQLAAFIAHTCETEKWKLVAWVDASSRRTIKRGLAQLGIRLGLELQHGHDEDAIVHLCLDTLRESNADNRILIFDNVRDIQDLTELVPEGPHLRVIATTTNAIGWRQQSWHQINVGMFTRSRARDYLLTTTGSDDSQSAELIANCLGDLPLALAQAAATASNEKWPLEEYLRRLNTYCSDYVVRPVPGDSYKEEVSLTIALALETALSTLESDSRKHAEHMVNTLALLAESGTPTDWFKLAQIDNYDKASLDTQQESKHRALSTLINASIIQQSNDTSISRLHRLQSRVIRENWSNDEQKRYEHFAAAFLNSASCDNLALNQTSERIDRVRNLIVQLDSISRQQHSHAMVGDIEVSSCLINTFSMAQRAGIEHETCSLSNIAHQVVAKLGTTHPQALTILNNLGVAHYYSQHYETARQLFQTLLTKQEELFGSTHPDTLATKSNLASVSQSTGRLDEAITAHKEILNIRKQKFGEEHSDTIASRAQLASAYTQLGRIDDAVQLYEESIDIQFRNNRHNDPLTLSLLRCLGDTLSSAGYTNRCITSYTQVIERQIQVIGKRHPDTITTQHSLARAYQELGKINEAIEQYKEILIAEQQTFGNTCAQTLTTQADLAASYGQIGHFKKAISLFKRTIGIAHKHCPEDVPLLLNLEFGLSSTYRSAGKLKSAINLLERSLSRSRNYFGEEHPKTIKARSELGSIFQEAGRIDDAITQYNKILTTAAEIYDATHPNIMTIQNNLATAYRTSGRLTDAIDIYENIVSLSTDIQGPDHPDTLTFQYNLACTHIDLGNIHKATLLLEDIHTNRRQVLGEDHPDTLRTYDNLASLWCEEGDFARSIRASKSILSKRTHKMSPWHPDNVITRTNLAIAYRDANQVSYSIKLFNQLLFDIDHHFELDQPHSILIRANLAQCYQTIGQSDLAITIFESARIDAQSTFGFNAPDTLTIENNLARVYVTRCRFQEAIDLYKKVLATTTSVFGHEHFRTQITRSNLETAYRLAGVRTSAEMPSQQ